MEGNKLEEGNNKIKEGELLQSKGFSLAVSMEILYRISNAYVYSSYFVQFGLFTFNLYIISNNLKNDNANIWIIFLVSFLVIVISTILSHRSKKYYDLGETIRKIDMIERIFPEAKNNIGKSYLLSKLPYWVIKKARKKAAKKTDYFSNGESKYEILIENIQQNCYFTSEIMRHYALILLVLIFIFSLGFIVSIGYGFFVLSENGLDTKLSDDISSYLALFINFVFTLNIIDHYISFNSKSKELKYIDEDLKRIKKTLNEDEIITSFADYNCVLCDALPCPDFIYKLNEKKLNFIWDSRVVSE